MRLASLSTWRGFPQWTCLLCKDTALTEAAMRRHLLGRHTVAADRIEIPAEPEDEPVEPTTEPDSDDAGGEPPKAPTRSAPKEPESPAKES